jgi:hypothetical protein
VPTVEHKIVLDNVFKNVRSHFERHKVAYSFGAGLAIAGITCAIMKGRIVALAYGGANGLETADTLVTNRPFFSFWSGQSKEVHEQRQPESRSEVWTLRCVHDRVFAA